MIPRFLEDEIVRVVRVGPQNRGQAEWEAAIGREAVFDDYSGANDRGTGWSVSVWLDGGLWIFEEDELETTGDWMRGLTRQSFRTEVRGAERHDQLFFGVRTTLLDVADALRLTQQLMTTAREVAPADHVALKVEPHWHEPFEYEIGIDLRPTGLAMSAFESLVTLATAGHVDDDGWLACFHWDTSPEGGGGTFLDPAIVSAGISLAPWSSPTRRQPSYRQL